jgi:GNAT superfamily N-acetyltransferase
MTDMLITHFARTRTPDDLGACERLARDVHRSDGYPVFVPDGDFRRFIASPDALAGWVIEGNDGIVGHVALHPATSLPMLALVRSELAVKPREVGVIARLLVAPSARRRGIGRGLLDVAASEARRRGLIPILDVVTRHASAIALYEDAGWTRLGQVDCDLPDGTQVEEFIYRAPSLVASAP